MAAIESAALDEIRVPDIGDFKDIPVIEVLVKPGSIVAAGDPIVTLESDKATLDVPAQRAGRVVSIEVSPGTRVSQGALLIRLAPEAAKSPREIKIVAAVPSPEPLGTVQVPLAVVRAPSSESTPPAAVRRQAYAGPSVRRMARELGVDLDAVKGTGPRGRIVRADVIEWVQVRVREPLRDVPVAVPTIDYSKFGEFERVPLKRISRISAEVLARNWRTIPHVTNFEDADVTDLEAFRKEVNEQQLVALKLTLTVFVVKACAAALQRVPALNVALDRNDLIVKKFVHVGVAVDSKDGLLVPVLRDVDKASISDIAMQFAQKVEAARGGKLKPQDMQGGSISISSLGSIGGRNFTPIINAPEVAIIGLGKIRTEARWDGSQFRPRQVLPISLSWDHRALDGVTAARFLMQLISYLEDFRRAML